MKRLVSATLAFALLSIPVVGFVGCADEAKDKTTETVTTPTGSTTTTLEKKVESSGSNPPTNSAGEKAK